MKFLILLFLVLFPYLNAFDFSPCCECKKDQYKFVKSVSKIFKNTLKETYLTNEYTRNHMLYWSIQEWTDGIFTRSLIPHEEEDDDNSDLIDEYNEFHFQHYPQCAEAIAKVYSDLDFVKKERTLINKEYIRECKKTIAELNKGIDSLKQALEYAEDSDEKEEILWEIEFDKKSINKQLELINERKNRIEKYKETHRNYVNKHKEAEAEINNLYLNRSTTCWEEHQQPRSLYDRGMLQFNIGETFDALVDIERLIENVRKEQAEDDLKNELLLQADLQNELGLYNEAIVTLTDLIKKDPENKEAYFKRASSYFETGDFESSLKDFLISEKKSKPVESKLVDKVKFSLGISQGALKGGLDGTLEFIPSLLSSAYGLGQALWAFAEDPVQVSSNFVDGAKACIDYIRESSTQEIATQLVPELQELVQSWDQLDFSQRGEKTGYVIGKYGVDIFAGVGVSKCMKAYRNLKRANTLLTFEAAAVSQKNKKTIAQFATNAAQTRKQVLKNGNLKMEYDKQGKHIIGHRNFDSSKSGVWTYDMEAQSLVDQFAGTGFKDNNIIPGTPGYKEIVNFKEEIGYVIDLDTKEKITTTWGKIHYSKNGVHIVPRKPIKSILYER